MANTTAVIVALPPAMDPIRLVGDEEKHATLLFFGETETLPAEAKGVLLEATEKVAKLFPDFGEMVNDVSRLGDDVPPALVAMLSNRVLGKVRDSLKLNAKVDSYLLNAAQHPNYTPHVTFGYPDYQAEVDIRRLAKRLYRVRFDRLALWWNDEHYEFDLGNPESDDSEMAMSESVEDVLAHYGIKGMKWGVRRTDAEIAKATTSGKDVSTTVTKKGVVKVSGGKGQPPSEDAIKAAIALQKAKQSSTAALTTNELRDLNTRLQLEQQYTKLVPTGRVKRGQHVTKEILSVGSTMNDVIAFVNSPAGKSIKKVLSTSEGKHVKR